MPPASTSNGTAAAAGAEKGAEKAEKGDTPESTSARAGVCATSTAADTCGGTSPAWSGGWREGVDAEIYFRGPASVVALLRAAIAAFQAPGEPAWQGCERLLAHVIAAWEELPRHRDPVFARDGWRCAVPGCSARRNLHDHHLRFRSRGGEHTRDNRLAVCAWHHLRGIHGGRVRAWGTAPDQVNWELGVRPGGPPLLRLVGDRYVATEEAYKTTADCPDDGGEPCHAEESQVTAEESVTAEENYVTAEESWAE